MGELMFQGRPWDVRQYPEATAQLREALFAALPAEYRRGIKFGEQIPESLRQFLFQYQAVALRGAVGALAVLLVAWIGLANMLLVSVHQEFREIGVRRTLGAPRRAIARHYVTEGVSLSALGSAAGLLAGVALCWGLRAKGGPPLSISAFWGMLGAAGTVAVAGAVALFPALAAGRIEPVEALRYD